MSQQSRAIAPGGAGSGPLEPPWPASIEALPETGALISNLADVELPSGWLSLPSGVRITPMPLWDVSNGLYARLGWQNAADWLAAKGMRLPTTGELDELFRASLFIAPNPLPDAAMLAAAGIPATETAVSAYRNPRMRSPRWCAIHDAQVNARLSAADWAGQAVANAGKHWCLPLGGLYGWWYQDGSKIQDLYMGHGPTFTDSATTVHGIAA